MYSDSTVLCAFSTKRMAVLKYTVISTVSLEIREALQNVFVLIMQKMRNIWADVLLMQ